MITTTTRAALSLQSLIQDTTTELAVERDYAAHQAARGRHREARATLRKVASLEAWLAYLQGEFARVLADGQEAA